MMFTTRVRLQASTCSAISAAMPYPMSGPMMMVPPDGVLEFTEENAWPLLRAGWTKAERVFSAAR
jgi:hypothetical protein